MVSLRDRGVSLGPQTMDDGEREHLEHHEECTFVNLCVKCGLQEIYFQSACPHVAGNMCIRCFFKTRKQAYRASQVAEGQRVDDHGCRHCHAVKCGECMTEMKKFEDETVCMICDPPQPNAMVPMTYAATCKVPRCRSSAVVFPPYLSCCDRVGALCKKHLDTSLMVCGVYGSGHGENVYCNYCARTSQNWCPRCRLEHEFGPLLPLHFMTVVEDLLEDLGDA